MGKFAEELKQICDEKAITVDVTAASARPEIGQSSLAVYAHGACAC
jgi:hypothetical protein